MKKTSWQLFITLFATTLVAVLLIFGISLKQAFPQAAVDYNELVAIPPRSEINQGLTSPDNEYMTSTFGLPSTEVATEECSNTNVKPDFNVTENVGSFSATGYKPAIEALKRIFAKVKQDFPRATA